MLMLLVHIYAETLAYVDFSGGEVVLLNYHIVVVVVVDTVLFFRIYFIELFH